MDGICLLLDIGVEKEAETEGGGYRVGGAVEGGGGVEVGGDGDLPNEREEISD